MLFSLIFFSSNATESAKDTYDFVFKAAQIADANKFHAVWLPERHFTKLGSAFPNPAIAQAGLALVTKTIRLHAGSVVLPLHDPIRVVEDWAMVDNLSGGRIGVSFASGWNPDDFVLAPVRFRDRSDIMFAGIENIRRMWNSRHCIGNNGLGEEIDITIHPKPVQSELPIWVTASGRPATFVRAGTHGTNLLTHLFDQDISKLGEHIDAYRSARKEKGWPGRGHVTVMLHTFLGPEVTAAREMARKPYVEWFLANKALLNKLSSSRGQSLDVSTLPERELRSLIEYLFDRFASTRSLIGSAESGMPLIADLQRHGVDEVACLVDFGPAPDIVLQNLRYLAQLGTIAARAMLPGSAGGAIQIQKEHGDDQHEKATAGGDICKPSDSFTRCKALDRAATESILARLGVSRRIPHCSLDQIAVNGSEAIALLGETAPIAAGGGTNARSVLLEVGRILGLLVISSIKSIGECQGEICRAEKIELQDHARVRRCRAEWVGERENGIASVEITAYNSEGDPVGKVSDLCIQYATTHRARRETNAAEELFFNISWKSSEPIVLRGPVEKAKWIIVEGESGIGDGLRDLISRRGEECITVTHAEEFTDHGNSRYGLDFKNRNSSELFFNSICRDSEADVRAVWLPGVVFDVNSGSKMGSPCVESLIDLVGFVQSALAYRTAKIKLWIVTRSAIPHNTDVVSARAAPLWGFGRALEVEHPEIWGGLIDLDVQYSLDDCARYLLDALLIPGGESQRVLRGPHTFVPVLLPAKLKSREASAPVSEGAFLVTGGTGGIGSRVVNWLKDAGAKEIVVLSRKARHRNGSSRDEQTREEAGAKATRECIHYAEVDVRDMTAVQTWFNEWKKAGRSPIRGVFHLAATAHPSAITNLSEELIRDEFQSKAGGAWNLHRVFRDSPVQFFVMFSALPTTIGAIGAGAASYAAANAYLDGLAHHRRSLGLPATSINFGNWCEVGMASRMGLVERFQSVGFEAITPDEGLAALSAAMANDLTQIAVARMHWTKFVRHHSTKAISQLCRYMVESEKPVCRVTEEKNGERASAVSKISAENCVLVTSEIIAGVLQKTSADLPLDIPVIRLGVDSLMAIEVRNRLEERTGVVVSIIAILEGTTIRSLANHVFERSKRQGNAGDNLISEIII